MAMPNSTRAFPSMLFEPCLTLRPSVEPGFFFPSGEREAEAEQALGEDRALWANGTGWRRERKTQ